MNFTNITSEEAVRFLQRAVRCDTIGGGGKETALATLLFEHLQLNGIAGELSDHEKGSNLLAVLKSKNAGPKIVLCGHMDTVPLGDKAWSVDPLGGQLEDGRLYGRGTADMKGGLIALLFAFLKHSRRDPKEWSGTVYFAATFGEETGAEGALAMASSGALDGFDAMIIAEPTDNRPVIAHKGVLWVRVEASGKAGHASMPESGVNAVALLQTFASQLGDNIIPEGTDALLGKATAAITMFNGGQQVNVIPDKASLMIDIRTLPGQDHSIILASLAKVAKVSIMEYGSGDIVITPLVDLPPVRTSVNAPVVKAAMTVLRDRCPDAAEVRGANYFTDGAAFQAVGNDIIILGPGSPEQAHQTDEYIRVDRFLEAIDIYDGILEFMMKSSAAPR